jgi:hypothetical protein
MRPLSRPPRRPILRRTATPRGRAVFALRDIAQSFARSDAWMLDAEANVAADALAEARLLETLAEPEIRLIHFRLDGLVVEPALLRRVAAAVRTGVLQVVALRPSDSGLGPALFSPRLDAICLRDPLNWDPVKRAALLREAVRAGLHLAASRDEDVLREAAGDVAAAIRIALDAPEIGAAEIAALPGRRERAAMRLALRAVREGGVAFAADDPDCLDLCEALRVAPERSLRLARALALGD